MRKIRGSLPYTWLHQLEVRNAMRLRVFRCQITPVQREASLNFLKEDLAKGIFQGHAIPMPVWVTETERLSALHTESLGTRSLDILHVAAAKVMGAKTFLTFDLRQARLAMECGLKTPTL